jgi:hypothetical protein
VGVVDRKPEGGALIWVLPEPEPEPEPEPVNLATSSLADA